ncbi:MAG: capsular polysaccharide synthesis protein [Elusimicrobiota bacterium]|jgi:hypothetical protein|nr:capsular polysaccharide synthesis protein [Elusimicrobiota bacterium]
MKKRIFTFWEPQENIPGYISLCMQTWKKFLADYEVILCDYSNISAYLDKKIISKILCKKMSLPMQADALRAALINKYGGIWMDADTIITSADFLKYANGSDVVMIGRISEGLHGAFIYATKPKTEFMSKWFSELPHRVFKYRILKKFKFVRYLFKKEWRAAEKWDYLLNSIINPLAEKMNPPLFSCIDKYAICAFPEYFLDKNKDNIAKEKLYQDFYFKNGNAEEEILSKSKGIVLLHNSWTPENYKKMKSDEFLRQDILLADLLRTLSQ